MKYTKAMRAADFYRRMNELGFSYEEADKLRLIEKTLQRWGELECGNGNDYASWGIERDEATGKPYMVTHPNTGKSYRRRIADREAGALRRLQQIMAHHPELWAFHQGDPRGCALYIGHKPGIVDNEGGLPRWISQHYTRGVAVCID